MRLNHLKSNLRTLSSLEDTPDVIVLHVAGNDLGAYEIGDLRYFLRAQLLDRYWGMLYRHPLFNLLRTFSIASLFFE
jgi:hypothetical protein